MTLEAPFETLQQQQNEEAHSKVESLARKRRV